MYIMDTMLRLVKGYGTIISNVFNAIFIDSLCNTGSDKDVNFNFNTKSPISFYFLIFNFDQFP